ncbi:MAG: ATP-binding protein [Pyrinomonadaceae bacterium MAG19_C2-C3]|nr:ATP-binding protein [Pyrinomonadaceae bacterium MAG19_C2-C3]
MRFARLQIGIIGVSIVFITALHFATPLSSLTLHEIYQRLYYVPILAAAVLFGLRGGLGASVFVTLAYLPHIFGHWQHHNPNYALNQYAEIIIFNLVGITTGALGDRSRRARARLEHTAEELQNAYGELRSTFEQLLQADRLTSLGELAAGVVHEVRNPLGAIKGAVEIMEDAVPADDSRREFAGIAKREVDRLDKLVGEFLRFARPVKPAVAPADMNEVVRAVATLLSQQAAAQDTAIHTELDSPLPRVLIDSEQIKQVLLNLVLNALQANARSGEIALRTLTSESTIVVEVEDTGGGVEPAMQARVFDPFFTTKEKGVGLGLSIAYKIVAQHGGTLTLRNGARGAIFHVMLPRETG